MICSARTDLKIHARKNLHKPPAPCCRPCSNHLKGYLEPWESLIGRNPNILIVKVLGIQEFQYDIDSRDPVHQGQLVGRRRFQRRDSDRQSVVPTMAASSAKGSVGSGITGLAVHSESRFP
eukprot:760812-Hanusia_phi.AAC.4